MPVCPGCGNEIQEGEGSCGQCGTALAKPGPSGTAAGGSVSKIELDAQLLNTLLAMASKPGGPQLRLEAGQVRVQVGEHSVALNPIRLHQVAQVMLSAGALGKLNLSVDLVHLGEQGLEVQLRLT